MMAIHYIFKTNLIIHKKNGEIVFLENEEKFENEMPIIARNEAFNRYQNYIDVLLEVEGEKHIPDKQAREKLKAFPERKSTIKIDNDLRFDDVFYSGIGVYLVIDNPIPCEMKFLENRKSDEILIHGIGNFIDEDSSIFFRGLTMEFDYYNFYGYDTGNEIIEINYFDRDEWAEGYGHEEPNRHSIIKTPFDWTGYDKEYWWGKTKPEHNNIPEININNIPEILKEIIQGGENNQVEFKPSLLYNFKTQKAGIGVKGYIAKAICAFLNSNGGFLFIGVKDNGDIQGLSYDYSLSEGKEPKDFFRLQFDDMIKRFLSLSIINNVTGEFQKLDGKDIFVVTVFPSKRRPIFLNGQDGKEFYVRGEASSRKIIDIEELANYCIEKWGRIE